MNKPVLVQNIRLTNALLDQQATTASFADPMLEHRIWTYWLNNSGAHLRLACRLTKRNPPLTDVNEADYTSVAYFRGRAGAVFARLAAKFNATVGGTLTSVVTRRLQGNGAQVSRSRLLSHRKKRP